MMHAAPAGPACWDSLSLSLMRQKRSYSDPLPGFSPLASALSTPAEDGVFKGTTRSPTSAWSQSALLRTTMPTTRSIPSPTPGGKENTSFPSPPKEDRDAMPSPESAVPSGRMAPSGGGTTRRFPRRRTPSGARGCRPGGEIRGGQGDGARPVGVLHAEHVDRAVGLHAVVAAEVDLGGLVESDLGRGSSGTRGRSQRSSTVGT